MFNSNTEDLILAKKLLFESKYQQALKVMNNFEKKAVNTTENLVKCYLLKCELLIQRGLYKDAHELAKKAFKESLNVNNILLTIDTLLSISKARSYRGNQEKVSGSIKKAETLLNSYTKKTSKDYMLRKAYLLDLKRSMDIYSIDQQLKFIELSIIIRKKFGTKFEIIESYLSYVYHIGLIKNQVDRGLELLEQAYALATETNNIYYIAWCLIYFGLFFKIKGDFDKSLVYIKQSLAFFEEIDNKTLTGGLLSQIGEIYRLLGDLELAFEYTERGLSIREKLGIPTDISTALGISIDLAVEMGNLDLAKQYLLQLKQLDDQINNQWIHIAYLSCKASILKTSKRARNRVEAEEIYKWIIEEGDRGGIKFESLLGLCDLLLTELRMTNEIRVLDELEPYVYQLEALAESNNSFYFLAELCLLQAKISLITLDLKGTRRFLIKSQQIAERYGYKQLILKINHEQEYLTNLLDKWEKIEEINGDFPSIDKRMEFAGLDEQLEGMLRIRRTIITQIVEEKVTIHKEKKVCLICKGQVKGMSYICRCNALYCEKCVKALIDLENVCWVCEAPLDITRSQKLKEDNIPKILKDN